MPQARITDSYAVNFPLIRNMIQSTSSTTNREAKSPLTLVGFVSARRACRRTFVAAALLTSHAALWHTAGNGTDRSGIDRRGAERGRGQFRTVNPKILAARLCHG